MKPEAKRAQTQKVITRLIESATTKPRAVTHSVDDSTIGWPMDLQDQLDFIWLRTLSGEVERGYVMMALSRMHEAGQTSVDDYENRLADVLLKRSTELRKAKSEWTFLLPFHARIHAELALPIAFDAKHRQVVIRRRKEVFPSGMDSVHDQQRSLRSLVRVPEFWVCLESSGAHFDEAWPHASADVDLFRGALEFAHGFGSSFTSSPKVQLARFPFPDWMVIRRHGQGDEVLPFISDCPDNQDRAFAQFTDEHVAAVRHIIGELPRRADDRSTDSLVVECLRLYVQALDTRLEHLAVLGLWQCIEAMTRATDHKGSTDKIRTHLEKILSRQLGEDAVTISSALEYLAEMRNIIVHQGVADEARQDDSAVLKFFCDVSIMWLMVNSSKLPTIGHIAKFFELADTPDNRLDATEDCIAYVKAERTLPRKDVVPLVASTG